MTETLRSRETGPLVLAAGLSPAWQQILLFSSFEPGQVNRAHQVDWCASGKVLNVARVLHELGGPCRALTVAGGVAGQQLQQDFASLSIPARWILTAAPTRVCTTIIDQSRHQSTELVPETAPLADEEWARFCQAFSQEAESAAAVVLIGSVPRGAPVDCYRTLIAWTRAKVIVDARGPELLAALEARPFLVKPNRAELAQTLGRSLLTRAEVLRGMAELQTRGAQWVVVTDGPRPILALTPEHGYEIVPPEAAVVNPIGCGDALAAGLAWAVARGMDNEAILRFGAGAAVSKLRHVLPGRVEFEHVERFASICQIRVLS